MFYKFTKSYNSWVERHELVSRNELTSLLLVTAELGGILAKDLERSQNTLGGAKNC